jgi:hypothetical protein
VLKRRTTTHTLCTLHHQPRNRPPRISTRARTTPCPAAHQHDACHSTLKLPWTPPPHCTRCLHPMASHSVRNVAPYDLSRCSTSGTHTHRKAASSCPDHGGAMGVHHLSRTLGCRQPSYCHTALTHSETTDQEAKPRTASAPRAAPPDDPEGLAGLNHHQRAAHLAPSRPWTSSWRRRLGWRLVAYPF